MSEPEPSPGPQTTREALLDAAERLFAQYGIANASLRAITREAEANLAAVHYHFGSKEGLIRELFARRIAPLTRERLARLDRCEAAAREAGGDAAAPELRCVLAAFVAPVLEMLHAEEGTPDFARIVGRAISQPAEGARAIVLEEFRETKDRFWAALARAVPHVGPDELFWRFHFMVGAMAHTAACGDLSDLAAAAGAPADCRSVEPGELTEKILAFLEGAMSAPAASPAPSAAKGVS